MVGSRVKAQTISLYTTQEDFTGWNAFGNMNAVPSTTDLDGATTNGAGNNTASGGSGTAGSLGLTWIGGTYNGITAPSVNNNQTFRDALQSGGTMYIDYTPPSAGTGNYFQLLANFNYPAGYNSFSGNVVDNGNGTDTVAIPYTFDPTQPHYYCRF